MYKFNIFMVLLSLILLFPVQTFSKRIESVKLKAFYTPKDIMGWDVVLVGKVMSFSSKEDYEKDDLLGRGRAKSKVTVRFMNGDLVNVGDTLLIINSTNLIVARFKVSNIFDSRSFGKIGVGFGNFKLASMKDRVVKRTNEGYSKNSYIYKSRGDYFKKVNQVGKAIREYKKALELDKNNPSARLELGYLYIDQGLIQFAYKEFEIGYKNIKRLYDNEDKFRLLRGLAKIRYDQVFNSHLHAKQKMKYRINGIKFCKEALVIYPKSVEITYMLGAFYYYKSLDDVKAKNYFLKVVKLDPEHSRAYTNLSVLYYKHNNKKKAKYYAELAVKIDPNNSRAKDLLRKFKK